MEIMSPSHFYSLYFAKKQASLSLMDVRQYFTRSQAIVLEITEPINLDRFNCCLFGIHFRLVFNCLEGLPSRERLVFRDNFCNLGRDVPRRVADSKQEA
jgi:hypothetical protein